MYNGNHGINMEMGPIAGIINAIYSNLSQIVHLSFNSPKKEYLTVGSPFSIYVTV